MWIIKQRIYSLFILVILCTYVAGMFVPVMEIDAAQYASISDQVLHNNNILQIKHRDIEYLDKPPLLFWFSAVSIRLFGVSSFAYKIPSVLGLILGVYSTYKFCNLYYKKETSITAATILASCQAFFSMANDCRTDNLLIGFACFTIWKISSYITRQRRIDLFLGFAGIGLAMLAKGPLGLVFPAFTIGSMMIVDKNYKTINWKWFLAIPIISILLLPMCIGLYQQHGKEGFEFYFWTQSFGKITGQSEWKNTTDPFLFLHSFLWRFLTFTIFFLGLLLILSLVLIYFFNQSYPFYYLLALLALLFVSWLFWKHFDTRKSSVIISVLTFTFVNLEFNTLFYPKLLKYQSSSESAFYIRDNHLKSNKVIGYNAYGHALSFYLDTIVPFYWDLWDVKKFGTWNNCLHNQ